jgi:uncharacterized protein YbjT (DUF2867 family)
MLVTQALTQAGRRVTAILRSDKRRGELEQLGVQVLHGDAMDPESLPPVLEKAKDSCSILLNLIGGNPFQDPATWPDFSGVKNVTDAAVAAGWKRYLLVTSVGTGASAKYVPADAYIRPILELKSKAEDHLKQSGLDWTIIKPGGLGPPDYVIPPGEPLVTENHGVRGLIARADLARVILSVLNASPERSLHRELYTVTDRIEFHAGNASPFKL